MQHFIVNGVYQHQKPTFPLIFMKRSFQETEAVFEKEGNPGNNLIPRIPDIQEIFDHPVVDGALTGPSGSKLLHTPPPPLPLQPAGQ